MRKIDSRQCTRWATKIFCLAIAGSVLRGDAVGQSAAGGTYRNPILFADYSDPDVIRDGANYYLVSSTFEFVPGIPILQSTDLVHWTIIGHVLPKIKINPAYDMVGGDRYGKGVWAPSIRKHAGLFYVYFPTPDEGIFMSSAAKITGPWTEPVAVIAQAGLEDPCPFWDDDGNAYLVHSKKGAGPFILHRMSADGKTVLDEGKEIVRDPKELPTLEGPKFYKRNGFYYIFAPFGGVSTGAQTVLRSKSIYGPYEHRTVLAQGSTKINGPHQGGYVETADGQGWFVHFQSRGAHGRIVHLEPVRWESDWPIMGQAAVGATAGEPVSTFALPHHAGKESMQQPQTGDEFSSKQLGAQWEWNHNPEDAHWSLDERPGFLRLKPMHAQDIFSARNTLTQMMQDEALEFTVRMDLRGMTDGTHGGLAMFEKSSSGIMIVQEGGKRALSLFQKEGVKEGPPVTGSVVDLRVHIDGDVVTYSYSLDQGRTFQQLGAAVPITFSWWKGSRPSLFAYTTGDSAESGHVDFDWARYRALDTVQATAGSVSTFHVAADGSADYKSVQSAIDSVPATGGVVVIAPGTYREQVIINQSHVTLRSTETDPRRVIIVDDTSQGTRGTKPSYATVHVLGNDFRAENITFENDFNRTHEQVSAGSQAQALNLEGDRNILSNVQVLGNQDTLYIGAHGCGQAGSRRPAVGTATNGGTPQTPAPCVPVATRSYFTHCVVAGNVDFIYGDGNAVFNECEIHNTEHAAGGYVTAQGKYIADQQSIFVFQYCRFTAEPGLAHVFLGRPWRPYASVAVLNSTLGAHIDPEGWREWHPGDTHSLDTAFYAEFGSTGPGANAGTRESKSHQLSETEAKQFDVGRVLSGTDGWNPEKQAK